MLGVFVSVRWRRQAIVKGHEALRRVHCDERECSGELVSEIEYRGFPLPTKTRSKKTTMTRGKPGNDATTWSFRHAKIRKDLICSTWITFKFYDGGRIGSRGIGRNECVCPDTGHLIG